MVGFWIRAGKAIVGTKPGVKFKGQKKKLKNKHLNKRKK